MKPHNHQRCSHSIRLRFPRLSFYVTALLFSLLLHGNAFSIPPDKIQQTIDAIRRAYYCEDDDYHTDGQRTVWVKSYKRWTPQDWPIVQKEAPHVLKFFRQAIEHHRPDVLEQLMPDYYRAHGGVKAFEKAINALPPASR